MNLHTGKSIKQDDYKVFITELFFKIIYPPVHNFLEKTIPAIRQAFKYGADIVEIDTSKSAQINITI